MKVHTTNGWIQGTTSDGIAVFKGIPYAQPPIGELRWKAPQPVQDWDGIRDGSVFGNASIQPVLQIPGVKAVEEPVSEDCLYLNVWAPADAIIEGRKLPVLVIIHGGGFQAFSGAYDILQGEELARQGIVVVTINYRLGVMGFLAHPLLSQEDSHGVSGNYGILDQIEAMKWVRKNIAAFGGDPDKVTVSGESAGAFSVSILCMSPLAKGLFRAATAQSGGFFDKKGAIYELYSLRQAEAVFAERIAGKSAEELRAMSAEELMERTAPIAMAYLKPVVDGYVFPAEAKELFRAGKFCDVPLLLGSNCDDGAQFCSRSGEKAELLHVGKQLAGEDNLKRLQAIYPCDTKEQTVRSQIQLTSDMSFGHNMYVWAKLQEKYGSADVFLYDYCYVPPLSLLGAYHSSELPYFFHNLRCREKPYTEADYAFEALCTSYLVQFVKNGDPNGSGLPVWRPFAEDDTQIMRLDSHAGMIANPTKRAMDFWDEITDSY